VLGPLQQTRAASPALPTPPRVRYRPRKPINWRKVGLAIGIPALIAGVAVAAWHFLPRQPLPPEKSGTILDRATAGTNLTFNDGTPGRQTLVLSTGNDIWEISTRESIYHGPILGYIFSPDGRVVLAQANDSASLYDWKSEKRTMLENPAPQWVSISGGGGFANIYGSAAFSNSGSLIAGARPNGSLHLLDTTTGKVVHTLREGGNLISNYGDEKQTCKVHRLAFSSDDTVLAFGEGNGNISLWNTKTGDLLATLSDQDRQPCDGTAPQSLDPFSEVLSLEFSPSGRLLASQDSYGVVRVWQVSAHNVVYTLPFMLLPAGVLVRFSPDGQFLVASGGFVLNGEAYKMYLVWNAASGRLLRAFSSPGPGAFAFLPNGNLVTAQVLNSRVKVENWALRSRFRIPFVSSTKENVGPSDSVLLQAYEEQAMQTLKLFQSNTGRYMSGLGKGSFPQTAKDLVSNRQTFHEQQQGYRYVYSPGPRDDQGRITSYVLSARPLLYQQTGTRSFLVDQTGQVHTTEEAREATASDPIFRSIQDAIQTASNAQPNRTLVSTPSGRVTSEAVQGKAENQSQVTSREFTLSEEYGATEVIQFPLTQPSKVVLEALWEGNVVSSSEPGRPRHPTRPLELALILNGPGLGYASARRDGPSPLRLEYQLTAQDPARGEAWKASIINFSKVGPVRGSLRVTIAPATHASQRTPPVISQTPVLSPLQTGVDPNLTKWLTSEEYQQEFNSQMARRYYPPKVEGRLNGGQEQYRSEWEPFPPEPFEFASFIHMNAEDYEQKNQFYVANHFSLHSLTKFVDASGITRYQATWVKRD